MRVLDLFCGLGGFSRAFRDRGHWVVGVDIIPPADVVGDVLRLPMVTDRPWDVILASPPCTEYTRHELPWYEDGPPDLTLMQAAFDLCSVIPCTYWVIENVRGAMPFWPPPTMKFGSRRLWGDFPLILMYEDSCYGKNRLSSRRHRERAMIPYSLSLALCEAMEHGRAKACDFVV